MRVNLNFAKCRFLLNHRFNYISSSINTSNFCYSLNNLMILAIEDPISIKRDNFEPKDLKKDEILSIQRESKLIEPERNLLGNSLQNKREYNKDYYFQNKDKIKESNRDYYLQNKDKKREYSRKYYIENKEKIKEGNLEYKIQNKTKIQEANREYKQKNKEKIIQFNLEYRIQNKEKINEYYREYRILNKDKMKEYHQEYSIRNKEKLKKQQIKYKDKFKEHFIQKNIERNNGHYVPLNSWKTNESIREYFERISPLLHISDLSDWYRISRNQINELKGSRMFPLFGSLGEALKVAYPDYDWDMSKFSLRGKKSLQRWLCVKLKKLLPNTIITEEYNHPELLWEDTKKSMQFDIWIPEYNLALEYQGEHHYFDLPGAFGPGSTTMLFNERDEKKKQICASKGIHLACIPYWWDGHEESLSATLHDILPNVFHKTNSPPIPTNLPSDHKKNVKIREFKN